MNYKNFINNEWFDSDSGNTFEVVNPFTEKVIANVPASGKSDIDKAVRAAQVAFKGWSTMTAGGRRDYLQALAQKSMDHADSLAKIISDNTNKNSLISIVGGGDTISSIKNNRLNVNFTHLSTAGGAFLEYIEGKNLPGIEVLK